MNVVISLHVDGGNVIVVIAPPEKRVFLIPIVIKNQKELSRLKVTGKTDSGISFCVFEECVIAKRPQSSYKALCKVIAK
jgi:hypothetical protein